VLSDEDIISTASGAPPSAVPFNQMANSPNIPAGYQDRVSVIDTAAFRGTAGGNSGKLAPMAPEQLQSAVRYALQEAVAFEEETFSGRRTLADSYYQGETRLPKEAGRSEVTVTAVRDAVKAVTASLARIFTQTDIVGEFYSDDEEDEKMCSDATRFVNSVFWKNGGYRALISACVDALKSNVGIIKVSVEDEVYSTHKIIPKSQLMLPPPAMGMDGMEMPEGMMGGEAESEGEDQGEDEGEGADHETGESPSVEAGEGEEEDSGENLGLTLPEGTQITEESDDEVVITTKKTRKKWRLMCIPGDEFIIDSGATSMEDFRICAHRRNVHLYEAVAMGFKLEDIEGLVGEDLGQFDEEKNKRKGFERTKDEGVSASDPMARVMLMTEAYMVIDADGDGHAELRKITCGGLNYQILSDVPVNFTRFAAFTAELQPHVFYPISLAEDTIQDQDAQTALLRSIINNAAQVNSPRTEVNESKVNLEDAKNGQIGAIIRVKEMGQINELATPFVAGQTLPVLQHLQDVSQSRSGVTKLSQGLDPDALQSTTKVAAQAAVSAADARIEMMARNCAETGVTALFLTLLKVAIEELEGKQQINTPQGYMTVRPDFWHDQVSVRVNVGLGSGRIDEKKMTLMGIIQSQMAIVTQYGPANEVCGWNNVRNSYAALLRLSGIHNTSEYFPFVPPDKIKELDAQMKAAAGEQQKIQLMQAQSQTKVMQDMADAEKMKSDVKYKTDMAETERKYTEQIQDLQAKIQALQSKQNSDLSKELLVDDRTRDKMVLDFIIEAVKINMDKATAAATLAQTDQNSKGSNLQ